MHALTEVRPPCSCSLSQMRLGWARGRPGVQPSRAGTPADFRASRPLAAARAVTFRIRQNRVRTVTFPAEQVDETHPPRATMRRPRRRHRWTAASGTRRPAWGRRGREWSQCSRCPWPLSRLSGPSEPPRPPAPGRRARPSPDRPVSGLDRPRTSHGHSGGMASAPPVDGRLLPLFAGDAVAPSRVGASRRLRLRLSCASSWAQDRHGAGSPGRWNGTGKRSWAKPNQPGYGKGGGL